MNPLIKSVITKNLKIASKAGVSFLVNKQVFFEKRAYKILIGIFKICFDTICKTYYIISYITKATDKNIV